MPEQTRRIDRSTAVCRQCGFVQGGPSDKSAIAQDHADARDHIVDVSIHWDVHETKIVTKQTGQEDRYDY